MSPQRREGITDRMLGKAIANAEHGPGQGKSGGYRTMIAYRRGDRAVFLFDFAKSERANLDAARTQRKGTTTLSQWERGERRPTGAALKLCMSSGPRD